MSLTVMTCHARVRRILELLENGDLSVDQALQHCSTSSLQ